MLIQRRSRLTDLAGLGLLGWAVLLGYVSFPTLLSDDPFWDGGVSAIGGLLAVGHLAAAIGVTRRAGWARTLAMWMGAIGLFGSGAVLLTLGGGLLGPSASVIGSAIPVLVLAIPAGMFITYGLIVLILLRARTEF
jgi:hypothetical protein